MIVDCMGIFCCPVLDPPLVSHGAVSFRLAFVLQKFRLVLQHILLNLRCLLCFLKAFIEFVFVHKFTERYMADLF